MTQRGLERSFLLGSLIGILILTFFLFLPFLPTMVLAATFAIVFSPIQERLTRILKGRAGIAALITILLLLVLLLLPLSFAAFQVFQESRDLYQSISTNPDAYVQPLTEFIHKWVQPYAPQVNIEFSNVIKQSANYLIGHLADIFSGTAQTLINILLGLITLFYFLRDGKRFVKTFAEISPLPDRYDLNIVKHLEAAVNSVIRGNILIALIQGLFSGIGFWIFGVPNPSLWGTMAAICALIPGVGTSLVLVPAIAYLFLTQQTLPGLGMLLWGLLAVGTIDNFLGPQLVGKHIKVHPLFILFSVLGGLSLFGPFGFIFGPLIMSLLVALLDIWKMTSSKKRAV